MTKQSKTFNALTTESFFRAIEAIDASIELYADPSDPFESVRDYVGFPEAREMITIGMGV